MARMTPCMAGLSITYHRRAQNTEKKQRRKDQRKSVWDRWADCWRKWEGCSSVSTYCSPSSTLPLPCTLTALPLHTMPSSTHPLLFILTAQDMPFLHILCNAQMNKCVCLKPPMMALLQNRVKVELSVGMRLRTPIQFYSLGVYPNTQTC